MSRNSWSVPSGRCAAVKEVQEVEEVREVRERSGRSDDKEGFGSREEMSQQPAVKK